MEKETNTLDSAFLKTDVLTIISCVFALAAIITIAIFIATSSGSSKSFAKLRNSGNSNLYMGYYEDALASYEEALLLDPNSKDIKSRIYYSCTKYVDTLISKNEYDKASEILDKYYTLTSDERLSNLVDSISKIDEVNIENDTTEISESGLSDGDPFNMSEFTIDGMSWSMFCDNSDDYVVDYLLYQCGYKYERSNSDSIVYMTDDSPERCLRVEVNNDSTIKGFNWYSSIIDESGGTTVCSISSNETIKQFAYFTITPDSPEFFNYTSSEMKQLLTDNNIDYSISSLCSGEGTIGEGYLFCFTTPSGISSRAMMTYLNDGTFYSFSITQD